MKRENVLIEALPYIREFYDSIMVVKIGGRAMVDPRILEQIVQDVVLLRYVGVHPVVVHGGGPEITEKMERMGKETEFVAGLRVTDKETLEIARMVLVGNINTRIVSLIGRYGGKGVGLVGSDGNLILAKRLPPRLVRHGGVERMVDLGFVGEIEIVNPELLMILAGKGFIPVVSPIAVEVESGEHLNVNADTVAGDLAAALKALKLISLTDVPGVLREEGDASTRISRLELSEIEELVRDGVIRGGMVPKVTSGAAACRAGVKEVHIIDGSRPHALLLELFTDEGVGTMIYRREDY